MAIKDEIVNPANVFDKSRFVPKKTKIYNTKEIEAIYRREKKTLNKYWTLKQDIDHYAKTELEKLKGYVQDKKGLILGKNQSLQKNYLRKFLLMTWSNG